MPHAPSPLPRLSRALQTLCYDQATVLPVIDTGALGEGGEGGAAVVD